MNELGTIEITTPQVMEPILWDNQLSHPKGLRRDFYKRVREMRRDPTIKLVREFAIAPLLGTEWSYEATPDAPEGAKEFIEDEMNYLRLQLMRHSMLGCIDYGWQSFERLVCDRPDGGWGIEKLKPLLPDITTILVDKDYGNFIGLRQDPAVNIFGSYAIGALQPIYLTCDECVLISQDVEGQMYYGEPTMKSLEAIYDEQQNISKAARKYDVKIAGSHWVIYYPLGTSRYMSQEVDNAVIAKNLILSIEAVGGLAIPRSVIQATDALNTQLAGTEALMWKVELISDKGAGQTPFLDRFKYLDVLKVRAFGFPERAMLEGQFGTKAEAEAHADLAILNMDMKHKLFCEQFDCQLVDWLLRVNYGEEACCTVKIVPAPLADRAKQFLMDMYKLVLANPQGFMQELQAIDMKGIRDRLGVPELQPVDYQDDLTAIDGFVEPVAGDDVMYGDQQTQEYDVGVAVA